jgi:flavin reductase (DIM6/NTAB) family NADH-FMN oxidoreductase RutF
MELDLVGAHASRAYPLLAGLVTPRPIALVTTLGPDGVVNAAPFSFFNVFGAEPAYCGFAPADRDDGTPKDTARNIRLNHEFVVNLVDEAIAEAMNRCAAALPYGTSELAAAGLTTTASSVVRVPRITESPVSLECVEHSTLHLGDNRLVIGLIKRLHAREGLIDPQTLRVNQERLHTIGRMASPNWYCRTRDRFELARPE